MFFTPEEAERHMAQHEMLVTAEKHKFNDWMEGLDEESSRHLVTLLTSITMTQSRSGAVGVSNFYIGFLKSQMSRKFDICFVCGTNHMADLTEGNES